MTRVFVVESDTMVRPASGTKAPSAKNSASQSLTTAAVQVSSSINTVDHNKYVPNNNDLFFLKRR